MAPFFLDHPVHTTCLCQCSVRDLRLIVTSVSTRVHEASLVGRLIGRLETEHTEMVYAHIGASHRCPNDANAQRLNCTTVASLASQTSHINCSRRQNFSARAADAESLNSVATATHDAVLELMEKDALWYKLGQKSRSFLHATVTANATADVISGDYSTVVDELMLLFPLPPSDVTLPPRLLCGDCETALFASVSGLLTVAVAQQATGSQCSLGHVFYACGRLSAVERFYFRSNWSRVESGLRDVRHYHLDAATEQLYADTIECPQRVFTAISSSIEQSRDCATTGDVSSWYSACEQMLSGTNNVVESLIAGSREVIAAAVQHCVLEIIVYVLLICAQVHFVCIFLLLFLKQQFIETSNALSSLMQTVNYVMLTGDEILYGIL